MAGLDRGVSVIIPTLDEQAWLPRCLDALLAQVDADPRVEVCVVDGGSRDGTREAVAARRGVRWLEAPRGRGSQMNCGARAATRSLLVFLAADTLLPAGAVEALLALDPERGPRAGGFRQRFDRGGPILSAVSAIHNLRATLSGIVYGDQVPFVERDLFFEVGGYREDAPMEDVEFGGRLRRRVRPRLLSLTVTTSARRFERRGALRATAEATWILACWTLLRRIPRSSTFFDPVR